MVIFCSFSARSRTGVRSKRTYKINLSKAYSHHSSNANEMKFNALRIEAQTEETLSSTSPNGIALHQFQKRDNRLKLS